MVHEHQNLQHSKSEKPLEAQIGPLALAQFMALSPVAIKMYVYLRALSSRIGNPISVTFQLLQIGQGVQHPLTIKKALTELTLHQMVTVQSSHSGTEVTILDAPARVPEAVVRVYTTKLQRELQRLEHRLAEKERELEEWHDRTGLSPATVPSLRVIATEPEPDLVESTGTGTTRTPVPASSLKMKEVKA